MLESNKQIHTALTARKPSALSNEIRVDSGSEESLEGSNNDESTSGAQEEGKTAPERLATDTSSVVLDNDEFLQQKAPTKQFTTSDQFVREGLSGKHRKLVDPTSGKAGSLFNAKGTIEQRRAAIQRANKQQASTQVAEPDYSVKPERESTLMQNLMVAPAPAPTIMQLPAKKKSTQTPTKRLQNPKPAAINITLMTSAKSTPSTNRKDKRTRTSPGSGSPRKIKARKVEVTLGYKGNANLIPARPQIMSSGKAAATGQSRFGPPEDPASTAKDTSTPHLPNSDDKLKKNGEKSEETPTKGASAKVVSKLDALTLSTPTGRPLLKTRADPRISDLDISHQVKGGVKKTEGTDVKDVPTISVAGYESHDVLGTVVQDVGLSHISVGSNARNKDKENGKTIGGASAELYSAASAARKSVKFETTAQMIGVASATVREIEIASGNLSTKVSGFRIEKEIVPPVSAFKKKKKDSSTKPNPQAVAIQDLLPGAKKNDFRPRALSGLSKPKPFDTIAASTPYDDPFTTLAPGHKSGKTSPKQLVAATYTVAPPPPKFALPPTKRQKPNAGSGHTGIHFDLGSTKKPTSTFRNPFVNADSPSPNPSPKSPGSPKSTKKLPENPFADRRRDRHKSVSEVRKSAGRSQDPSSNPRPSTDVSMRKATSSRDLSPTPTKTSTSTQRSRRRSRAPRERQSDSRRTDFGRGDCGPSQPPARSSIDSYRPSYESGKQAPRSGGRKGESDRRTRIENEDTFPARSPRDSYRPMHGSVNQASRSGSREGERDRQTRMMSEDASPDYGSKRRRQR